MAGGGLGLEGHGDNNASAGDAERLFHYAGADLDVHVFEQMQCGHGVDAAVCNGNIRCVAHHRVERDPELRGNDGEQPHGAGRQVGCRHRAAPHRQS